jgi:hypothetical protein
MKFKLALAAGAVVAAMAFGSAQAGVLYSTGFEPGEGFVTGGVDGQQGWTVFSASAQQAFAQVETGTVASGVQAVGVDGDTLGQTGPYYGLSIASPGHIDVSADIFLTTQSGGDSWQFGITGPGLSQFAGGIDITGGTISAISGSFPTIGTLSDNAWHHVDVVLNYSTQKFKVKLDGSTLAGNLPFCGSNGACNGATVSSFGDGLFDTFGNARNFGYMDNFSIGTVPEPASWALMLLGVAGLGASLRTARRRTAAAA